MAIIEVELKTVAPRKWIENFGLAAPTLDSSTGVNIGDVAVDSSAAGYVWTCMDATIGAPVWQQVLTTQYITQNASPSATVAYFASSSLPAGWLECNGAAISRTTYATLFSRIGTTYGAGDNVSTFNVPDLRGYFIRGWDHGAGIDTGRNIGTVQADSNASHTHVLSSNIAWYGANPADPGGVFKPCAGNSYYTETVSLTSGASGGTESRPKNVALMACIKY